MKKANIFKIDQAKKIIPLILRSTGKYLSKKPLIFNLNLNATNICNQNCPMCNAVIVGQGKGESVSLNQVKKIYQTLEKYHIASLTISGGEPSLVKEMPEILDFTADKFPLGVNVNSNLYASQDIIIPFAKAALKNNVRIGTSFDGFGPEADRLRGAKDVANRVLKNIELVTQLKKELNSNSTLNVHTVISDTNLNQLEDILAISDKYGWTHTLAPVNNFFYQEAADPNLPKLDYSPKLEEIIKKISSRENISVSDTFLLGIPNFTKGQADKFCPYLTGLFKTYKVFLEPNGDLSLCSRKPIGNIFNSSVEEIIKSDKYKKDLKIYRKCDGCWIACFVEILLATPKIYQKIIKNS